MAYNSTIKVVCSNCGNECDKSIGHYNRAVKLGAKLFCSQKCFGLNKRTSIEEKKTVKAAYDKKHRKDFSSEIKAQKAAAFKVDYASNPEKYKQQRQKRYPKHLEYLRRPEYKQWKQYYDEKYRAAKLYGEFSEAAIILKKLEDELESKIIKQANGITFNKSSQKRKRKWQQLTSSLKSLQVKI